MPVLDQSDPVAVAAFADFVRHHPARAMTQDPAWGQVKQDWGYEGVYLERAGQIVAAMSVLVRKVGGLSLLYAPRGPVADLGDLDLVAELVDQARPLARKHRAIALRMDPEVRYDPVLDGDLRGRGWRVRNRRADKDDLIQPRHSMILYFDGHDADSIMTKFSKKLRSNVRRAVKQGTYTDWANDDQALDTFFDIYQQMARRQQITTRGREYFTRMRDAYGEMLRVYLARHEGDTLAAAITINYEGKLTYLYAGSTDHKRTMNPNHVMNYDMIRWGIESGGEQYDLGGVFSLDPDDGLYKFKKAFCDDDGVTELIGEVDVVYSRPAYLVFTTVLPRAQRLRRTLPQRLARARQTMSAKVPRVR